MKHHGRGVIRLDDHTDHGGTVIAATSATTVMGKGAAREGDLTYCPRCHGTFAILAVGTGARQRGRPYAYDGDRTECGARLITTLS